MEAGFSAGRCGLLIVMRAQADRQPGPGSDDGAGEALDDPRARGGGGDPVSRRRGLSLYVRLHPIPAKSSLSEQI
jgi:hypothetical protein